MASMWSTEKKMEWWQWNWDNLTQQQISGIREKLLARVPRVKMQHEWPLEDLQDFCKNWDSISDLLIIGWLMCWERWRCHLLSELHNSVKLIMKLGKICDLKSVEIFKTFHHFSVMNLNYIPVWRTDAKIPKLLSRFLAQVFDENYCFCFFKN